MGSGEREEKKRGEGVPRCSTFELEPDKEALDKSRKSSCRCYHHHCAWIVPLLFSNTSLRHCVVPSLFPFLLSRANLLSFDPLQLMECTTFPPALAIFGIRKAHDSICFEIVPSPLSLSFFFFLSERKTSYFHRMDRSSFENKRKTRSWTFAHRSLLIYLSAVTLETHELMHSRPIVNGGAFKEMWLNQYRACAVNRFLLVIGHFSRFRD